MYPERLIPSQEKLRLFEGLEDGILCRYTIDKENTWIKRASKWELNDSLISVDVSGNSCNLIDLSHRIHCCTIVYDLQIEVINKEFVTTEWDGEDDSVPEVDNIDFERRVERGYYFLRYQDFNGYESTYPFRVGNKEEQRIYEIRVRHSANLVNICHFEINGHKAGEDKPIDRTKNSRWVKDIKHMIRERIIQKAISDIGDLK